MHESPVSGVSTNAWGSPLGSIGVVYPSARARRTFNLHDIVLYVVLSLELALEDFPVLGLPVSG